MPRMGLQQCGAPEGGRLEEDDGVRSGRALGAICGVVSAGVVVRVTGIGLGWRRPGIKEGAIHGNIWGTLTHTCRMAGS